MAPKVLLLTSALVTLRRAFGVCLIAVGFILNATQSQAQSEPPQATPVPESISEAELQGAHLVIRNDCTVVISRDRIEFMPAPDGVYFSRVGGEALTVKDGSAVRPPCTPVRGIGSKGGFAIGGFNPA